VTFRETSGGFESSLNYFFSEYHLSVYSSVVLMLVLFWCRPVGSNVGLGSECSRAGPYRQNVMVFFSIFYVILFLINKSSKFALSSVCDPRVATHTL
jgi:hypothetical protein